MRCFLPAVLFLTLGLVGCGGENKNAIVADVGQLEKVVEGNNAFAFDLYKQLRQKPGNHFFSPYSISAALAMAHVGAKNETALQMAQTLHLPTPSESLPAAFGQLQTQVQEKQAGFTLHVANSLWGQKGVAFRPPFLETLRTHFGGAFQEVDFQAGGADAINQWVKQQTHDQIPKMLEPQDITPLTRLILVNAIYLKGKWASRFRETSPFHFFPTPKEFFPHPIMSQANDFPYTQTKTVQVLEMPYQGETASMVVLLPLKRHGLAEVEELLTPENWSKWLGWLVKNKVNVYFPRLTLDHDYWLEKTLPAMGMALAFDPERADFSGMVESVRDDDQLHIKKVIHKVRVEIDEAGTEAAGASGVIHEEKSEVGAPRRFERPVEFMVNHPFVFLIRDRQTGSILFMGRVVDPRGK